MSESGVADAADEGRPRILQMLATSSPNCSAQTGAHCGSGESGEVDDDV